VAVSKLAEECARPARQVVIFVRDLERIAHVHQCQPRFTAWRPGRPVAPDRPVLTTSRARRQRLLGRLQHFDIRSALGPDGGSAGLQSGPGQAAPGRNPLHGLCHRRGKWCRRQSGLQSAEWPSATGVPTTGGSGVPGPGLQFGPLPARPPNLNSCHLWQSFTNWLSSATLASCVLER
jgi:hypothetical protein